ncbi:MAG: hypothetical protein ACI8PZ_005511 [Myxococcota bacterium]
MILSLAVAALAADCPAPVSAEELVGKLVDAESAYEGLDVALFRDAMDEVALMLPCLDGVLATRQTSRLHTLAGLARFVAGQEERAQQAFAAARATASGAEVLARLMPEGHGVWEVYGAIPLNAAPHAHLPAPDGGTVYLDGTETLQRPERWATLFQHTSGDDITSAYLFPGDAAPPYASVAPVIAAGPAATAPVQGAERSKGTKLPGWIAVGVGGAATAGLAIAGSVREAGFLGSTGPVNRADAEATQRGVNATYGAAMVVGGVTLGGTVAVIAW